MTTYAGWQLRVFVGTGSTLQSVTGSSASEIQVQRITYDYTHNIDAKEATGQRTVYAFVPGVIGINGTIERFYTGSGAWKWARGATETGSLTAFHIGIFPNGTSTGQPYEILKTVYFGSRRSESRPGSALKSETNDFVGTSVDTGSIA